MPNIFKVAKGWLDAAFAALAAIVVAGVVTLSAGILEVSDNATFSAPAPLAPASSPVLPTPRPVPLPAAPKPLAAAPKPLAPRNRQERRHGRLPPIHGCPYMAAWWAKVNREATLWLLKKYWRALIARIREEIEREKARAVVARENKVREVESLVFPASRSVWTWPRVALTLAALAALYFGFGAEGVAMGAAVGGLDPLPDAVGDDAAKVLPKVTPFSKLGMALASIKRRMGHLPMATATILPGGDGAPKVIFATNGRDNIGLVPFAEAFNLQPLGEQDVLLIEANGANQDSINAVAASFIKQGYRPVGTRMMIRAFKEDGTETLGAEYVRAIDTLLGSAVDVRSYFSLGSAPALSTFSVKEKMTTEREGETEGKEILWFTGKAGNIFAGLEGTEGGLPISEKAMEALFESKNPGQPRFIVRLNSTVAALIKGNFSPMAVRAFEDPTAPCGYKFLARGHFGNDEAGKEAWRKGHDFVFIEDDTPKGRGKDALKTGEIRLFDPVGKVSGWLIAQAKNEQGKSLVSYQVLALIADSAGLKGIADHIRSLVEGSVLHSIAQVKADLDKMEIPGAAVGDIEKFKDLLSAMAPGSARATRKNHLGFGAEVWTGYIHMNTLINKGVIVVGDGFGLKKRAMEKRRKSLRGAEDSCGGKNPILDHQQTWLGKLVRLCEIQDLAKALEAGSLDHRQDALAALLWGAGREITWMQEQVKWVMAFAPSLTRGSILMNADDVADLAGDDDGDQLWFSFGDEKILSVFRLIKEQAQGNTLYAIENNKKAQMPSETGARNFSDLLTLEGAELDKLCKFIMAPNKGQGPVGYLANICTILISTFPKVKNAGGGLSYENPWVERLQAILNLMQQTSIDMQKRLYLTVCLLRWTQGDLRKESLNGRGLVPGYDFPALAHGFDPAGFDPAKFSPEEYKSRLTDIGMPTIPCHWTSADISLCTANDSQYSIRAIGSWLIWECLSLIATGKPAAWSDEMAQDAKGGLDPRAALKFIGEDGPDVEAFIKEYKLDDTKAAAVRNVWQKSPSALYSWKTQGKDEAFAVKAPPAIELNHEIARGIKAAQKPTEPVSVSFEEVNKAIDGLANAKFANEATARRWVSNFLDGFYLEAALANNNKATSERFQSSEERSGVEALGYVLESLSNTFTTTAGANAIDIKIADAFGTALNPRERFENRKKVIGAFVALLAWWSLEYGQQEWVDILQSAITPPEGSKKPKYAIAMARYAISEGDAKKLVSAKVAKKLAPETMSLIKRLVAEHHSVNAEKLEAKTTWLVDDGLAAAVVALENTEIIMAKRDVLKEVQEAVGRWTDRREGWDEARVGVEILLAATGWFAASWVESLVSQLQEMVKASSRTVGEIRKDLKDDTKSKEELAELKEELKAANNAAKAKDLLALKDDKAVGYVSLLNAFCNPRQNPLAKEFCETMLANSGPIVNVERAWQRADQLGCDKSNKKDWTWELGDWVTRKGKGTDPTTGEPRKSKTYLYAHSRVEWALSDRANADFSRALLEAGVSHYKLSKVPAQSYKTWRYWDAVVYAQENTGSYSLVHGVGHLVSEAIPTQKQADSDRYRRMAHLGHLEWALESWQAVNVDRSAAGFEDSLVGYHEFGLKAEIARLNTLRDSALMMRWGHLWVPVSWGMQVHNWAGKLTQKAINGRAWAALAQLGKDKAEYHEQPKTISVDGREMRDVSAQLKPLSSNGKRMPFKRPSQVKGISQELARAHRQSGVENDLDDTEDLVPFTFGDLPTMQVSYDQWLDFIEGVAVGGDASALVLAGLWFGAHSGRISAIDPGNKEIYSAEIAEKIKGRLLRCPAYEVRLHLEDMFSGNHLTPVAKKVDASAATAFFRTIRKIAGLVD